MKDREPIKEKLNVLERIGRLFTRASRDDMTVSVHYDAGMVKPYGAKEFQKDPKVAGYAVTVDGWNITTNEGDEVRYKDMESLAKAAEDLYEEALKRR